MSMARNMATEKKAKTTVAIAPTEDETSESVRYKVFVQKFSRLVEAVRPVVVEFAVNALSKSLISDYNKTQAEMPNVHEYDKASILMSQILPKIKDSDAHFDDFVSILQELNLIKLASELRKEVDPTESRTSGDSDSASAIGVEACGFECPCGCCSFESYFEDRSKCNGLEEKTFPYLNMRHLNEQEVKTLTSQLIRDANTMIINFEDFSSNVFKALKRNEISADDIINTVFCSGKRLPKPIQDKHGDKLEAITTITGIHTFLVRYNYITFINYRILEKIISEHCRECQRDLDRYVQKLKTFSERSIFEIPSFAIVSPSCSSDHILVVKVIDELWFGGARHDAPNCSFTLRDIDAIRNKIAEVIELRGNYIDLVDISTGCIQLAFSILLHQEDPIFPLTTLQLSELICHGIIVLYQPKPKSQLLIIANQDTESQTHNPKCTTTPSSSAKTPIAGICVEMSDALQRSASINDTNVKCLHISGYGSITNGESDHDINEKSSDLVKDIFEPSAMEGDQEREKTVEATEDKDTADSNFPENEATEILRKYSPTLLGYISQNLFQVAIKLLAKSYIEHRICNFVCELSGMDNEMKAYMIVEQLRLRFSRNPAALLDCVYILRECLPGITDLTQDMIDEYNTAQQNIAAAKEQTEPETQHPQFRDSLEKQTPTSVVPRSHCKDSQPDFSATGGDIGILQHLFSCDEDDLYMLTQRLTKVLRTVSLRQETKVRDTNSKLLLTQQEVMEVKQQLRVCEKEKCYLEDEVKQLKFVMENSRRRNQRLNEEVVQYRMELEKCKKACETKEASSSTEEVCCGQDCEYYTKYVESVEECARQKAEIENLNERIAICIRLNSNDSSS